MRRLETLDCLRKPPRPTRPPPRRCSPATPRGAGFLLGPAGVDGGGGAGRGRRGAAAGTPCRSASASLAPTRWASWCSGLVGSEGRFAVVVDGTVVDLPSVADGVGATLQVGGDWTRAEADDVAARLT